MADIKIDEELLLRAGLGIGYAFAPFFRGILEGVEDYTIEQAFTCAKARFRTGYARSLASGARTECASSLAKKNGAPISSRARDLITADKTKKENVRLRRSGRSLFLLHSCKRSYSILKL